METLKQEIKTLCLVIRTVKNLPEFSKSMKLEGNGKNVFRETYGIVSADKTLDVSTTVIIMSFICILFI